MTATILSEKPLRSIRYMTSISRLLVISLGLISLNAWSAPTRVTLQLKWDHQFQFAGYYAARAKGYYDEAGLKVKIRSRVTDDKKLLNVFDELRSGRADFAVAGPDLLIALDKGLPAKIIATIYQSSPYAFVTRKGEFATPAQFSGKRINITEPSWGPVELHTIVKSTGGVSENFDIQSEPPSLELLTDKRTDVVATYLESATWQMQEMQQAFDIFRASDYGVHFYGDALLASDAIITRNPEAVRKFLEASLRGWRYALENPQEIAELIHKEYPRKFDWYDDVVAFNLHQYEVIKELSFYPTVSMGHTSPERWQKTIEYFRHAGHIDSQLQAQDIIYQPDSGETEAMEHWLRVTLSVMIVLLFLAVTAIALNRSLKKTVKDKTQDLQNLTRTLEQKVKDRTRELEDAKEEALEYAKAKSAFVANISHELRTPLNAVIGLSELSLRTQDQEKRWNYLRKINNAARSLLYLINDILDLSKADAGKLIVEEQPLGFAKLVSDLDDIFRYTAEAKGLDFSMEADNTIPEVIITDIARWKQILTNLIGNAIKFTASGKVSVRFTLQENNRIKVTVQDTGIGIAEENLDRLFVPFEQADNTIARNYGGTGLGLAISKKLADALGGDIGVESTLHEGSLFTLTLPFKVPTAAEIDHFRQQPLQNSNQVPVFEYINALVIEDQPLNREVITGILNECGITTTEAIDGEEGIRLLEEEDFNIIFLDIQMPGVSGYQVLDVIRKEMQRSDDIVIAMTAHARQGFDQHCREKGFSGYLAKPIEMQDVYQVLLSFFQTDRFKEAYGEPEPPQPATSTTAATTDKGFDEALIDVKSGVKRLRGKADRYQALLTDFINRKPNLVEVLTGYIGRGDMDQAQDYAHQMKGASGNLSLDSLHYCLEDLEKAIMDDDMSAIHQKLVDLGRAWRITEREVRKYLGAP